MSKNFVVVSEAHADFTTATELADRILAAEINWLDVELLDSQRQWGGEDQFGMPLKWTTIKNRASELGLRVHGHFDGKPGLPDAQAARRAINYVRRCLGTVDAILLIRDMDDQRERIHGLKQARASASSNDRIVIGVAIVERESWILCGFESMNEYEGAMLKDETRTVGFNPCLRPQDLTACKDDTAKRSPKRVLAALSGGDWERQRQCWNITPLSVLEARGQNNGLKDFLGEVRRRLVPLITGHEREVGASR